ncbi:uncharacterized protein LOC115883597 [Sitophilus oryzae]|uniref:Uncharacterized protein LOC115883597 n=1 Tax=Sitophilus oryzae TaxID=7048 RepID=A0A6J2Y1Z0_SITOR|nr:uncharacterized protein LOC115883597 [Sitophilus oryzae]
MKQIGDKNYELVKEHINSYHPQPSHYNLSHAPNRRYLTADLSIHSMYLDYNSKNIDNKVTYETYRKIFNKENIGFSVPTQDECGSCSKFKQHSHDENATTFENGVVESVKSPEDMENSTQLNSKTSDCQICMEYQKHQKRYRVASEKYMGGVDQSINSTTERYAVDMQKVIIIPKMTIKNSYFVSRLVIFHETFANLKKGGENMCILWHEAIMGRNSPDVTSAYYNMIKRLQNKTKHVIFWADNCTSQNKNWVLFTSCVTFVNEPWGPETITFKYFEPGHSFMKADSVHGQIGKKWKKAAEILDFEDLENLIRSSNKKNHVISLRYEDFRKFTNGCQGRKKDSCSVPKLQEIKQVQFKKGSKRLFFKKELEQEEYSEVSFLKPRFKVQLPEAVSCSRGINTEKKEKILKDLFWQYT